MKTKLFLGIAIMIFLTSCKKNHDVVVAEVYQSKLYQSEINNMVPDGYTSQDSAELANQYIHDWIVEQIILHEADKELPAREKNFEQQVDKFRNSLLINAYYDFITSDSTLFEVSEEELTAFMKRYEQRYTIEREIIKLNYVKLGRDSKLITPIKNILFDEDKRITQKMTIEKLCADSIEFFIEDNTWLYLDEIQNEFPISIQNKEDILTHDKYIETEDDDYHYLIVFLDYRTKRTVNETENEIAAARMMLVQQKKREYIDKQIETLYQETLEKGIISK